MFSFSSNSKLTTVIQFKSIKTIIEKQGLIQKLLMDNKQFETLYMTEIAANILNYANLMSVIGEFNV